MEIFRALVQVGQASLDGIDVLFHNTLASSAYGLLDPTTHQPRPHYWAWLLFNTLCGTQVYDAGDTVCQDAHVFAYSRADGREGRCLILVNNSETEALQVSFAGQAKAYVLTSDKLRGRDIYCNGEKLAMPDENTLPGFQPSNVCDGLQLPAASAAFLVL